MRRFYIQLDTGEEVDSDTGDLVRFADHAAEVSRLNNDLTAVILERDALKGLLESQKRATTGGLSGDTDVERECVRLRTQHDELLHLVRIVSRLSVNGRNVLDGIDWAVASLVRLALEIPDPRG